MLFQGSSADLCDGTEDDCTNELNVMVVCGADCVPPTCGCVGCQGNPAPTVWYALPVEGFSDNRYNGDWVWYQSADCTWSAACRGASSTLEFDAVTDPGNPVWRLTHDGAVYEKTPAHADCVEIMELVKVSGNAGPAVMRLTPFSPEDPLITDCCPDPPDTLYATSAAYGVTIEITRLTPGTGAWTMPGAPGDCDGPPPTFSAVMNKNPETCSYEVTFHATCCGGNSSGYYYPTNRDPFLLTAPVTNSDPQCEATDTVVISETPP